MNILFVISEMYRGGAEKMVANLAEYFAVKKKSHVCIAVFNNDNSAYQLYEGIKYIKLNCSSSDLKMRIPVVDKIRKVIKEEKIDVIIGFSIGISELLPFAVIGTRCRAIGSERSNPYLKQLTSVRKSILNHILERLDGMIFTTTGCRDYYSKKIRDKSTVIPNGFVPKEGFSFEPTLKHRHDSRNIIAIGNLREVKDYPTMLKAFKLFSDKHDDYTLNIYGEGIEEKAILSLISELDLEGKAFIHGSVSNLEGIYLDSCFMVHSSKSESWCNAILEALSFGVPCIAADCDFGPREMIKHGFNGFLVKIGDYEKMAFFMNELANDQKQLALMSENAYKDAKKFEFENIADKYYSYAIGSMKA